MDRRELLSAVGMIVALFLPLVIVFAGSGKYRREAQERERQRRLTDARMNAVLLRMNI
jgi:hypothetical protein